MDLVLHIGTEKTGTTLIQRTLLRNRDVLRKQGIALSTVLGAANNRLLPACFQSHLDDFHQRHGLYDHAARDRYFEGLTSRFQTEVADLRAQGAKRLIVSSEHLSSRMSNTIDLKRLRAFLQPLFPRVQVVCYLREQAALNRSLYSTAILNGYDLSFSEFAQQISIDSPYYNYEKMLGHWADDFAPTELQVAIYDPATLAVGGLVQDFFNRAADWVDSYDLSHYVRRRNMGITTGQAAVMRHINRIGLPNKLRRGLVEIIRMIPLADTAPDSEWQRKVADQFKASNQAVAKRFFNRQADLFGR